VRFTPAGREALTDALMDRRAVPVPVRRRGSWTRKVMAAGVAAAVLAGSALAVAGPLWERYFGRLDEGQQEVIENLSQTLPAAEANGTTMTPLAAFGDQDFYYLLLEIEAPEGTVLPDYGEEEGYYQLFRDSGEESIALTDAGGERLDCQTQFIWMPRDGRDNVLTAAILLWAQGGLDFTDGGDKTLHIPGLWVQSPDKEYTPVLSGGWDFNIGAHSGKSQRRAVDVSGAVIENERFGVITLESLEISPLGMRWRYSWTQPDPLAGPGPVIAVVMEDGNEIQLANSMGSVSWDDGWEESYGPFEAPIDLDRAAAVRWGGVLLSLKGK